MKVNKEIVKSLLYGISLTLILSLFARYVQGQNQIHFIYNGLPLPTLVQAINISEGEYVSIQPDFLGLFFDVLFWSFFVLVLFKITHHKNINK
ncbi:MAG: hypothetical protein JTT14_02720 [Candidatus Brockarchaeota archaeon]|nr:hypothetical protein [Candidatus Brockarchaeota archaeon]